MKFIKIQDNDNNTIIINTNAILYVKKSNAFPNQIKIVLSDTFTSDNSDDNVLPFIEIKMTLDDFYELVSD